MNATTPLSTVAVTPNIVKIAPFIPLAMGESTFAKQVEQANAPAGHKIHAATTARIIFFAFAFTNAPLI
jgi:hypothetical protein